MYQLRLNNFKEEFGAKKKHRSLESYHVTKIFNYLKYHYFFIGTSNNFFTNIKSTLFNKKSEILYNSIQQTNIVESFKFLYKNLISKF
ncbi:hypothetical protein BpHYR1_013578 [Brachionus plicatilis]|uniref:Uncharacterized protein n=1 Tax=Brachionus plicatilis TaxID=10195 RepID=A0A3M7QA79_BRAPC|nr:hypothetical protein BpHYR1_013578 [Brachionus plicatilis]